MKSRIAILFLFFAGLWVLLILRGASLQILPDARLQQLKTRQYETRIQLNARRGAIYDRNGKELAVTVSAHSLFADPSLISNPRLRARQLSARLNLDRRELERRLKMKKRRFVWIKRQLREEDQKWVRSLGEPGFGLVEEPKRVYPGGSLLAETLGFVGSEGRGLEGLELQFESFLRGEVRQVILRRDARGRPLLEDARILTDLPDGGDLHLTIDSELQFTLENELEQTRLRHGADAAVGIILDAQSSEVLAMSSAPGFDANQAKYLSSIARRNRAIADAFEPGSTMKTFVVASALKEGVAKPSTRYNCEGGRFKVGDRWIKEAEANHSYDWLTVSEILAFSSNVGMAKMALQMGDEKLRGGLREFGFGERSGIELPGETKGIVTPLPWRPHFLSNVSIGQAVAASPLQIASAFAAIANGGILKKPRLVKAKQSTPLKLEQYQTEEIRRVLTPAQAETMLHMLAAATSEKATGANARIPGFPIAGKTGTAQKVDFVNGGYRRGEYISSFAGIVPAHQPRFVIYVAIDNPKKEYYGSQVAAPLFARVAQYAVRRAGLVPVLISERNIVPEKSAIKANLQARALRDLRQGLMSDATQVPDLRGLSLRELLVRTKSLGLRLDIQGSGLVKSIEPEPGTPLPSNGRLRVQLSQEN